MNAQHQLSSRIGAGHSMIPARIKLPLVCWSCWTRLVGLCRQEAAPLMQLSALPGSLDA